MKPISGYQNLAALRPTGPIRRPETEAAASRASRVNPSLPAESLRPTTPAHEQQIAPVAHENLDREKMEGLVAELSRRLSEQMLVNHEVELVYQDNTDNYVVEVRAHDSGDLIVQFPPESLLKMQEAWSELNGTLLDKKS